MSKKGDDEWPDALTQKQYVVQIENLKTKLAAAEAYTKALVSVTGTAAHDYAECVKMREARDAALARVRELETALSERTEEWLSAQQYVIDNENYSVHVSRLREALEPMLAVLDGWVGDRTLFDSTPLHNIRAAARAVLEETKT